MNTTAQTKGTTQYFIDIWDIADDLVILRSGEACLIIETTAVNFQLLSEEEQQATLASFASLLNSLSFPIQIVIHSKRLDLSSYIQVLKRKMQTEVSPKLKDEAEKYTVFVESLMKSSSILDKRFYIAIPFSPLEAGLSLKKLEKKLLIEKAKAALYPKRDQILSLLPQMGIKPFVLSREELISLFHNIYNPSYLAHSEVFQNGKRYD